MMETAIRFYMDKFHIILNQIMSLFSKHKSQNIQSHNNFYFISVIE
jgi:hypothetical protein